MGGFHLNRYLKKCVSFDTSAFGEQAFIFTVCISTTKLLRQKTKISRLNVDYMAMGAASLQNDYWTLKRDEK